jgi:hypothetical protein
MATTTTSAECEKATDFQFKEDDIERAKATAIFSPVKSLASECRMNDAWLTSKCAGQTSATS